MSRDRDQQDRLRYSRHIALPEIGEDGHARLERASVLIVGLGGLGAPAAMYLAASGIGRLSLNDFDDVDLTNLQRQLLYTVHDLDRPKVEAALDTLERLNPNVDIRILDRRLSDVELLDLAEEHDIVVDGTDNFATRFAVNEACVRAGTPLVSGAAIRFEGQIAVFRADLGEGPCYRCLYDESGARLEDCSGQGVLAPLVGVIGSMMAVETIKVLTGAGGSHAGELLLYDALAGSWRTVRLGRQPRCPVCGSETAATESR